MMTSEELIKAINQRQKGSMSEFLGVEFLEAGKDFLTARMPVDERTIQPMGILHGGASVVLAETLGSVAANFVVDNTKYYCVGLDINANHIRSIVKGNWVYGKAVALHLGKTTQVWEIKLSNEQGQLTCISRLTMAVLERKNPA
ncbi:MAG: PaaI family thioesterase [Thermonemataceae bacterium]|nr:PaaI family thioesterase [Thermonemataceae bacterium]